MKTSESIELATVSLFEAVDLPLLTNLVKARQIFASELSNRLQLAMASRCALFKPIYQKFDTRRMNESYES